MYKLLCAFLARVITNLHKLGWFCFAPNGKMTWCTVDVFHSCSAATDPFTQQAWRKPLSHFYLSPHTRFYERLSESERLSGLRLSAWAADKQSPVHFCFLWPPSKYSAVNIIHDFSFNRKVPFMLRSPSLAAQIVITSCKAICLETVC